MQNRLSRLIEVTTVFTGIWWSTTENKRGILDGEVGGGQS